MQDQVPFAANHNFLGPRSMGIKPPAVKMALLLQTSNVIQIIFTYKSFLTKFCFTYLYKRFHSIS